MPEREELRRTFGQAAALYERVRPSYPDALYDDLVAAAGLRGGDRLLEVGCATGKAMRPLARRGFGITCVELSPELAAAARDNLAGYDVTVTEAEFETYQPDARFTLGYAATAWHWLDPAVAYQRAWRALRPGGHLAIWRQEHVLPEGGDPFFREIQDVYDAIGERLPDNAVCYRPGELPDERADIEASGLFSVELVRQYDWERVVPGGGVHRPAPHVLRAHRDDRLATRHAVRRDPATARATARSAGSPPLGRGAARRPPPRHGPSMIMARNGRHTPRTGHDHEKAGLRHRQE